jgi:hypothetical protein
VSTALTTTASAPAPPLDTPPLSAAEWDRVARLAWLVSGAGVVAYALVAVVLFAAGQLGEPWPRQLLLSYLTAWVDWLGVPVGCLVVLMVQHLTGGAWGLILRRTLEAATRTLPAFALLSIPVLVGVPWLYSWYDPHPTTEEERAFWEHKHLWLNQTGFVARTVVYFVAWLTLAWLLNRWSRRQEAEGEAFHTRSFRLLSGPGLAVYGAAVTFAAVDWTMSLEPRWFSTIYPVLFAVGQILTGYAFALAAVMLLAQRPPLPAVLAPVFRRDLGNLLLAFVMMWAYLSVSQLLLIWAENLPEEIPWYLRRSRGGWQVMAWVLAVFHFALPFLLLLARDVKESPRALAWVALGVLTVHGLDVLWWVESAYPHEGLYFWWLLDVAASAAIGGLTVALFVRQLRRGPVLPVGVPGLEEGLRHE